LAWWTGRVRLTRLCCVARGGAWVVLCEFTNEQSCGGRGGLWSVDCGLSGGGGL
jgi:hypothetical protein